MIPIRLAAFTAALVLVLSCSKDPTLQTPEITRETEVETVRSSAVVDYYQAVGTVQAKTRSVIASRIMGNIVGLRVREGDRIRAGQTLVELENRDAGIQIQKAQAGVREILDSLEEVDRTIRAAESGRVAAQANETLAGKTFNRYQALFDRHSVSPQEFDEVRAKFEVAKAERERAERMLQAAKARHNQVSARIDQAKAEVSNARVYASYARLTSPIDGVVISKHVDVGSMAIPGAPLLTIENDSKYQLEVSVEESQLSKIRPGDQAQVEIEALGVHDLTGSVEEIVPVADPRSRSYTVKVSLPNAGAQLCSGLYGKVRFVTGERRALAIPQKAITQRGQLVAVFVVDQAGVARMRLIKTGKSLGETVEVLSGLNDGEQIVVDQVESIQDGTRVRDRQQLATQ